MVLFLFSVFSGVLAQEDTGTDISTIDENAQLGETEGITPDSAFYFIDELLTPERSSISGSASFLSTEIEKNLTELNIAEQKLPCTQVNSDNKLSIPLVMP